VVVSLAIARAHDPITTRVTWTGEVSRIVQARCVSCHSAGGKAPMPLTSFEETRPWARAIKEEVLTRRMPKWHAARGYGDFSNDPSLSAFELALIAAWVDGGAPRGTDADKGKEKTEKGKENPADRTSQPTRELTLPCRNQPLPTGRLLAVRPELQAGKDLGVAVQRPDGQRDIVAWIRNYEPDFPTTYWLRAPIDLAKGTQLLVDGGGECRVTVTMMARSLR
jgi:hypothetical protein